MTPPTLMIVDDEGSIRASIQWFVEDVVATTHHPVRIVTHESAESALDAVRAHADGALVVIADYSMGPGTMDGLRFLHEVRELRPASRRILMSGYSMHDLGRADFSDVDAYLPKPFDAASLLQALGPIVEAASDLAGSVPT